jgi:pimeloyl-ACP methyl ester carboxylesterase
MTTEGPKVGRRTLLAAPVGLGLAAIAADAPAAPARRRKAAVQGQPRVQCGYAPGPFGQVHYHDTGVGMPVLLFHQAPMSARQFESVYPLFAAKGIRAIGIDMPGFGNSDPTDFVPRVEDWAKVAPAVMDHLGIRQADMVGHHTGAAVATEVCLQFPSRSRRLVIHAALLVTPEERVKRLAQVQNGERNAVEYLPDGSHLMKTFQGRYKLYGPGADPKLITRYVVERYVGRGPSWYGHNAAYTYDHGAALKRVTQPTQVMDNTGDMTFDMSKRVLELRPDFKFVTFQGGGVDIVDQQSQAWVDAVHRFLTA